VLLDLLAKKTWIEKYLSVSPKYLSCFSFSNIFLWKDFFEFDLQIIDKSLCIFAKNQIGSFLYLPPLGKEFSLKTIEECFEFLERENNGNFVSRIENLSYSQVSLLREKGFTSFLKGHEYYYLKDEIRLLKGNKYKSKRGLYNHFIKNNAFQYLPFENSMLDACISLYRRWADNRAKNNDDDIYRHMLEENLTVHQLALKYCKEVGLVGRVVLVGGEIKAYSLGFPLDEDIFCLLLEIADLEVKGLAVYIFSEFCGDSALAPYKFINAMDACQLDNIAKTKMSFRPMILMPSYSLTKKVI